MLFNKITNRKPEDGEIVLIYIGEIFKIARWFDSENSFWTIDIGIGSHYIASHWISLHKLKKVLFDENYLCDRCCMLNNGEDYALL